jgi:pimeloyl-ACP methyl ester carboxylesterase
MPVVHCNNVDLYYEIHGQGLPIVLAHGYCTSINLWKHQIPLLAKRYQVIAYDARGHGLSSAPAGKEHYTLSHLVADMHALLQHLGVEQAYIAGHSMGGATTAGFAARHPQMTRAALICNIDAGHQPPDPDNDAVAAETRRQALELVRQRGMVDYARQQIADNLSRRARKNSRFSSRAMPINHSTAISVWVKRCPGVKPGSPKRRGL